MTVKLIIPLHHPKFEIDEDAIITGVVTMAYAAYKYYIGDCQDNMEEGDSVL